MIFIITKLIYPIFVKEGISDTEESCMEGVYYHSLQALNNEIQNCLDLEINNFLIIGIPHVKNIEIAKNPENIACQAVKLIKDTFTNKVVLFGDVCTSPYQKNGHSMILEGNNVMYAESLEVVKKLCLNLAIAGADFVAPVISMQNSTKTIRKFLNENNFSKTKIMPYSAKFASSFYSPYRQTIGSPLTFAGKEMYQIDSLNKQAAINILLEDRNDSDILMIKPGLPYIDILIEAKNQLTDKLFAMYQVSGEYQMLKSASKQGFIDWESSLLEIYNVFKRVELDYLITYAAKDLAKILPKIL